MVRKEGRKGVCGVVSTVDMDNMRHLLNKIQKIKHILFANSIVLPMLG